MKQEDKELLLRDLCGRLPYGVKVSYIVDDYEHDVVSIHTQLKNAVRINGKRPGSKYDKGPEIVELWTDVKCIKPYLFPLSSMTEEIMDEIYNNTGVYDIDIDSPVHIEVGTTFKDLTKIINILYKHHIDYLGLIPMGLAIDCTNLNIY